MWLIASNSKSEIDTTFLHIKANIRIETNRAQQNVSANLDSVSLLSEKKDTYYIKIKQKNMLGKKPNIRK